MAGVLQHLRSSTLDKRPNPASMVDGQVAINYASGAPGMFFKDSNGSLVKVGPVHVGSGAPNAVPASGGTAGNSIGEQWLDTSGGTYVFKIWDGSAWRSEAGEFVNVTGDTMTGALGIIAGSASTPGLFISGDANTGLYSPGADQLALATNGTQRLLIDSSGNINIDSNTLYVDATNNRVGVGTSSPQTSAHVYHATDNGVLRCESGDEYVHIEFKDSTTTNIPYIGAQGNNLRAITGGAAAVTIDSSQRVGIGTTSPATALHVSGSGTQRIRITGTGSANAILTLDAPSTYGNYIEYGASASTPLIFYDVNASAERVRIDTSGRLLVGTSTDAGGALLQVNGNRVRIATAKTPASASDTGTTGEVCWDSGYIYVCTATNTWKRAALSTW